VGEGLDIKTPDFDGHSTISTPWGVYRKLHDSTGPVQRVATMAWAQGLQVKGTGWKRLPGSRYRAWASCARESTGYEAHLAIFRHGQLKFLVRLDSAKHEWAKNLNWSGYMVQVAGCRVQGAGCRVQGAGTVVLSEARGWRVNDIKTDEYSG
jgi:hypothetical protein